MSATANRLARAALAAIGEALGVRTGLGDEAGAAAAVDAVADLVRRLGLPQGLRDVQEKNCPHAIVRAALGKLAPKDEVKP